MNGAGVGGTRLAAVFKENEMAPARAFSGSAWMVQEWEARAWRQCVRRTRGHQHWPSGAVCG